MHSEEKTYGELRALLPDPVLVLATAVVFLRSRNHLAVAEMLKKCTIEYGAMRPGAHGKYEVDISIRCECGLEQEFCEPGICDLESMPRMLTKLAIARVLPISFTIGYFGPRSLLEGQGDPFAEFASDDGAISMTGKMKHSETFKYVAFDIKPFNQPLSLENLRSARYCLKLMWERKAFKEKTALHFDEDIQRHLRDHHNIAIRDNVRIHDYFSGSLRRVRKHILRAVGRSGKYYLSLF